MLGSNPRQPDGLQLMGLVRESQGKLEEAEALFRQSLELRPDQPHVQVQLGRVLARAGKHDDAIAALRGAAKAQPELSEAFLVMAQVQVTTGEFASAEANFRAALRLAPNSATALSELGALLNKMKRPNESEPVLRNAARNISRPAPQRAAIAHNLGVALDMQGRQDEAISAWRDAVALDPTNLDAHHQLNALLYRRGSDGDLLSSYDQALVHAPQSAGVLLLQKADFLIHAERYEEARDRLVRVAAMAPDSAAPQNGLANAYAGLCQFDRAIAAYEKALVLQPDDPSTKMNLAFVLLKVGENKRALGLTEGVVRQMPFNQSVLAVHEVVLRANGDALADLIADYEHHIQIFDLEPPRGFSSMEEFNRVLNAHLDVLHTDKREHIDQTLRHGTQSPPALFNDPNDVLQMLRRRIEEAVAVHIAQMPGSDGSHPLYGRRANDFAIAGSWSSRPHDCGFHTNHIHPQGWISSCYYVAVPDVVEDKTAKQGWIKFGEPSFKVMLRDPIRRTIQPAPGRLVLFPSYLWHGTIPFRSATARTTIAFDAVPV
ncbi:MAG: tetratricopeptide repeat protein [Alphaproteobacteria bacterium]|nr:tetratricopeptide repeat protein [Alphaproteobacteria bacterium]MDE2496165.1 tetratricopeptide repeat protein [Alphaproteobacteria bacterium]